MKSYTEAERAALIADCKNEIVGIRHQLTECGDDGYAQMYLESKLQRQEIALAALTAERVGYVSKNSRELANAGHLGYISNDIVAGLEGGYVYDAPPVAAPVVPDFSECPLCDSNFISGMQSGYRFGAEHDRSRFNAAVEHYRKEGRHGGEELKRLNANAPAEEKK